MKYSRRNYRKKKIYNTRIRKTRRGREKGRNISGGERIELRSIINPLIIEKDDQEHNANKLLSVVEYFPESKNITEHFQTIENLLSSLSFSANKLFNKTNKNIIKRAEIITIENNQSRY